MQIFQLICTLSPAEIRDVRILLRSDWYNYRDDVRRLFEILTKETAKKPAVLPDKKVLFRAVFPDKKHDDRLLRLVGSWLNDVVEDYFLLKKTDADLALKNLSLAEDYRRRNLPALYQQKMKLAKAALEKQPFRNADFFRVTHEILAEEYRAAATAKRTEAKNVQVIGDTLDHWFIAQKLRQVCIALSHQNVYRTEYKFGFLPETLAFVEREGLAELPAIGLYFYCFKALSAPENEAAFQTFREKLAQHGHLFPDEELRDLYLLAINFCTRRVNENSRAHVREGFELYRNGFERGIFVINGVLSRFTYRNAVALGLMLREMDWVADFLSKFRAFLEPEYRESTFNFSLARLEYERKNYDMALQLLQRTDAEYEDRLTALAAKTLISKILYEINAFDTLTSHLDAMAIFIKRHKEINYHRANYTNFIRFLRRLLNTEAERTQLFLEIGAENAVSEKKWLLEKAAP